MSEHTRSIDQLLTENHQLRQKISRLETELNQPEQTAGQWMAHQALLDYAVNNLPVLISYVDLDERYRFINHAYLEWFGCTREEIVGNSVKELLGDEVYRRIKPYLAAALAGQKVHLEEFLPFKRGGEKWVEAHCLPKFGPHGKVEGVFTLVYDISPRKKAEEALFKKEAFLSNIFSSIQDGISVLDKELTILQVNPTMEKWYSHSNPLVGKKCYRAYHLRSSPCEICPTKQTLKNQQAAFEKVPKTGPDGKVHGWIDLYSFPLLDIQTGELMGVIEYARDITEKVKAEEEQKKLERQVLQAQKLESLGLLAGGIAHDFNNLLVSILGNADIALMELPNESSVRRHVKDIMTASVRLSELTKQMLAYAGKQAETLEPLDLNRIIEEMVDLLKVSISKKVTIQQEFPSHLPPILGDATQIRQVILNLLTNASESIGQDVGVISLKTGVSEYKEASGMLSAVFESRLQEGPYVYLEVADTGCGMDQKTKEKIFDPFFSTKFTGRGLGLTAVLGILRSHKGAISVDSQIGHGSMMTIYLPCGGTCTSPKQVFRSEEIEFERKLTVLVVDDEEIVRVVATKMLEKAGLAVICASDGQEALDQLQVHAEEIDVVILDFTMPQMDGVEAFAKIHENHPALPVILCSGYNDLELARRYASVGFSNFLQKPFKYRTLMKKLKEVITTVH